jgi:L-ascorbate metabolism protein UlaG (beta-lactamase superfamily)
MNPDRPSVRDGNPHRFHPPSLGPEAPIGQALPVLSIPAGPARRGESAASGLCKNRAMELTWYGRTCIRQKGKDAVVVNDPYPAVVGPTGRGITGDVVTFSHPDDAPKPKKAIKLSRDGGTAIPTSLEPAFVLDGPGEYEVHDALVTGVRTYRDDAKGAERGKQVAFVTELDGIHTIHLGDIGHQLTEEKLADIGRVEVACVPIGGALSATRAAALIAQLDPRIVVPMTVCDDEADCDEALKKFLHEMGATPTVQAKLAVTTSSLPTETTTVLLESRGKI